MGAGPDQSPPLSRWKKLARKQSQFPLTPLKIRLLLLNLDLAPVANGNLLCDSPFFFFFETVYIYSYVAGNALR